MSGNELLLDGYLTSDSKFGYRDQEVQVTLYLPEGSMLYADDNTYSFHRNQGFYGDILENGQEEHFLKIIDDQTICEDCPADSWDDDNYRNEENDWDSSDDFNGRINVNGEEMNIRINEDGIEVNDKKVNRLKIDSTGIEINN